MNVYDMYWLNDYASPIGFGIFHSGVEVYGVEYAYGGHQFPFSGIFTNQPQDAEELGENFKFRESIVVGETDLTEKAVEKLVKSWGEEFRGDRYHLITKNCNHFTANFARELTGKDAPGWVNRLANVSNSIPFLDKMLPMEWLTPTALADTLDRETKDKKTLNYPVEKAEEAIFECGSPNSRRKISIDQSPTNPGTRRSFFVRRVSEITGGSAPNTSRSSATTTNQVFSRFWNSIRSLASDDSPTTSNGFRSPP
ncbi:unnamed protein product [Bursaphelenchus okinawaensis]|uniref:PPPDE domain-containing protein n=1 Tax=Bursaphelenchus okinawaensis TaxID=465554 RepID=A0A811LEQ8_9BILA|nr:unnamed protein product [Bursaphelenchus okinawaensis]CAG9121678.1 unnamed protein product [Bursaphelenchus okinawaensis]